MIGIIYLLLAAALGLVRSNDSSSSLSSASLSTISVSVSDTSIVFLDEVDDEVDDELDDEVEDEVDDELDAKVDDKVDDRCKTVSESLSIWQSNSHSSLISSCLVLYLHNAFPNSL